MGVWSRIFGQGVPPTPEMRAQIAQLSAEIDALIRQRKTEEARARCLDLAREIDAFDRRASNDKEARALVAAGLYDLGMSYERIDDVPAAVESFQRSLHLHERLAADTPDDHAVSALIPSCMNHLGLMYLEAKSWASSERWFLRAVAAREARNLRRPHDDENRVYLGATLCNLGHLESKRGDGDRALELYARAIETLDATIPGCTCGCRDMFARMAPGTHWLVSAQRFLVNALDGRAQVLDERRARYSRLRYESTEWATIARIDDASDPLRVELLDVVTLSRGPFIVDIGTAIDGGSAILAHVQGRVIGTGETILFVGASGPDPRYDSVDDALRALAESSRRN